MSPSNFGVGLLLSVALSASAMAQGIITDGDARFEFHNSFDPGRASFQPDGSTDHLYENWWWYRVDGATDESSVLWFPTDQSYVGNVATLGASEPSFDWELTVTLTDGAAPGQAQIVERMTLANTTGSPISVALFNYADIDVGNTSGSNGAILVNPELMRISDGPDFAEFLGVGADAWEVQVWSDLRDDLDDGGITNLSNTGLPFGPDDFTGAFQWNLTIPAGGQVTVVEGLSVNMAAVPEPATLSLLAFGVLALFRRR